MATITTTPLCTRFGLEGRDYSDPSTEGAPVVEIHVHPRTPTTIKVVGSGHVDVPPNSLDGDDPYTETSLDVKRLEVKTQCSIQTALHSNFQFKGYPGTTARADGKNIQRLGRAEVRPARKQEGRASGT